MKTQIFFTLYFAILNLSATGQTYNSVVQFETTPSGKKSFNYNLAIITFSKAQTELKIYYAEVPEYPDIFTLAKSGETEVSEDYGSVTNYRTMKDLNYSYLNYNVVQIQEFTKIRKIEGKYPYNYSVQIAQLRADGSVESSCIYFINK